ncbi:GatB/YqeY domain-containing protein [Thalassobaculum fulvum]|nr:GatB/YqeY domain-containing protein [Thalassobaculum fulvum]
MLREQLNTALKEAMRAKDSRAVATVRLILAALKDRDIAAREKGVMDGVGEDEVLAMLQTMIKQRQESIRLYEQGGRCELAEQEQEEIDVIRRFMPTPIEGAELETAVQTTIKEIGASNLKDMGRTMAALKERYPGRMDFSKASGIVRASLV